MKDINAQFLHIISCYKFALLLATLNSLLVLSQGSEWIQLSVILLPYRLTHLQELIKRVGEWGGGGNLCINVFVQIMQNCTLYMDGFMHGGGGGGVVSGWHLCAVNCWMNVFVLKNYTELANFTSMVSHTGM